MAIYSVRVMQMIRYKFDVLESLKNAGITTYALTKTYKMSPAIVQKLRENDCNISVLTINKLCGMLQCQPGDLLEWLPDDK